jgi:Na+-transporting methylmalonyl-CoA/oxaloacetate decarboxylase gamma subunit
MLTEALKIMGIGISVVFVMLALFYFIIRLLTRLFPTRNGGDASDKSN